MYTAKSFPKDFVHGTFSPGNCHLYPALVFPRLLPGDVAIQPNPKLFRSNKSLHALHPSVSITQPFPEEKGPLRRVKGI